MLEIVWSLMGEWKYTLVIVGLSLLSLVVFFKIWKIQLEKAYINYTKMLYEQGLSMKEAEKLFMGIVYKKKKGTKGEHEEVRRMVRSAIKNGRLIKVIYTYEGVSRTRYYAHDEEVHSFRSLMFNQAKWIRAFKWFRPFNIYRFTLHDSEFKKAIEQ